MANTELMKLIEKWVERDGKHIVMARLIEKRMGESMASKLVRGKYSKKPHGMGLAVIELSLKEAGILPGGEEAS